MEATLSTDLRRDRAAAIARALSDAKRLCVVERLADGERSVSDLSRDIGERTDVIASHADVARQMRAALEAWQADVETEAKAGGAGPSR